MVYVPGWWTYAGLYAEDIDLSYKYPLFNKPEYCQAEDIVRKRIAKLLPPGSDYAKQWNEIVSDAASHVKYAHSSDSSGNYKFSEREDKNGLIPCYLCNKSGTDVLQPKSYGGKIYKYFWLQAKYAYRP